MLKHYINPSTRINPFSGFQYPNVDAISIEAIQTINESDDFVEALIQNDTFFKSVERQMQILQDVFKQQTQVLQEGLTLANIRRVDLQYAQADGFKSPSEFKKYQDAVAFQAEIVERKEQERIRRDLEIVEHKKQELELEHTKQDVEKIENEQKTNPLAKSNKLHEYLNGFREYIKEKWEYAKRCDKYVNKAVDKYKNETGYDYDINYIGSIHIHGYGFDLTKQKLEYFLKCDDPIGIEMYKNIIDELIVTAHKLHNKKLRKIWKQTCNNCIHDNWSTNNVNWLTDLTLDNKTPVGCCVNKCS